MTTAQIINFYANLLILQYQGKPKAFATIQSTAAPLVMDQLPLAVQDAFDIDTAVGVQLDVLGKYVGASRYGYIFPAVPGDPNQPVTLNDSDFRKLIKMAIVQNSEGSSLADIQNLLALYFPDVIRVFDYANMHMDYFFDTAFGTNQLAEFFVLQKRLPKPMGVQLGALIFAPLTTHFWAYRTYDFPAYNGTPYNTYTTGFVSGPPLLYTDAIAI